MPKNYHVAIVGATGAVGIELLRVMERRNFPVADLRLLASPRSAGKTLEFRRRQFPVETLEAKKRILPQAARENWICMFYHDPDEPLCRLQQGEKEFSPVPYRGED